MTRPFGPFTPTPLAAAGYLIVEGSRLCASEGDGDWEVLTPLAFVGTADGGRFIFWLGGAGLFAMTVAILPDSFRGSTSMNRSCVASLNDLGLLMRNKEGPEDLPWADPALTCGRVKWLSMSS